MAYGDWLGMGGVYTDATGAAQQQIAANRARAGGGGGSGISGSLPWPSGAPDLTNPAQAYQTAYGNALSMNKGLWERINAGFDTAYTRLQRGQRKSMRQVRKLGRSERQDIDDQYNQSLGTSAQQLIDRGLGNTTVQQSVNRGIEAERSKANVRLTGELADLRAGYLDRFNQQRTALANEQLRFMNTMTAAYPDPGTYAAMMSQQAVPMGGGFGGASNSSGPYRSQFAGMGNWGTDWGSPGGGGSYAAPDYSRLPTKESVYGANPMQAASLVGSLGGGFMGGLGGAGAMGALGAYAGSSGAYGGGGGGTVHRSAPAKMGIEAWDYYGEQ